VGFTVFSANSLKVMSPEPDTNELSSILRIAAWDWVVNAAANNITTA
jgi:hypothetical protein